ncbi:hypothetical protein E3N88_22043 [Mikania micrantha]|uniref:Uncharacterized protein n=1 Tax=Mikania micrantha TaxID=192012 RepID=A0A5N6N9A2_9ASTR|nr:hypothetical protein E3N88_22033 [Mikania micrantha]KAD4584442.1 hypothetical protein E3N88_22043 [Mikania micrantha]
METFSNSRGGKMGLPIGLGKYWYGSKLAGLVDPEQIRFRVQNVKFPEIPKEQKDMKPFAPMEIIGSLVSDGGLGPISWWV